VSRARTALITGLTGQDGSFLAELLLEKGYRVTGLLRGAPERSLGPSEHLRERVELLSGDLLQPESLRAAIDRVRPGEIYHLAAPSFVPDSWERPAETISAIAASAGSILEAVRALDPDIRLFLSSSGSMFGDAPESPQREDTPFRPRTP
jgi:GDPmannose 4,6-dehydratase